MSENENKNEYTAKENGSGTDGGERIGRMQSRGGRRRFNGRGRNGKRHGGNRQNRGNERPAESTENETESSEMLSAEDSYGETANEENTDIMMPDGSEDSTNETESENTDNTEYAFSDAPAYDGAEKEEKSFAPGSDDAEAESRSAVEIVGIRFKEAGKVYYFDPAGEVYRENDEVIVETARGQEYGFIVTPNCTVYARDIVSPLKQVTRRATEEDRRHYEENNRRRDEAFEVCRRKIEEHKIEMKLVDVEYTFDNSKLLFYFTADGRVDFRELVKDLASVFRTRIELRQIGIRDEAKLVGGLGVCGRPFCCHSFLPDFVQVSIKMAKEQNLSLNSAKISGTCGRLMCCLRYEYDVYQEEIRKTPKLDTVVSTPDGDGVVVEVIPLAGMVRVRLLGARSDVAPKLWHRDNVQAKGKYSWKTGTITPYPADGGHRSAAENADTGKSGKAGTEPEALSDEAAENMGEE